MMSKLKLLVFMILSLSMAIPCHAGWRLITPMPHGRYGHDATLGPGGNIYVMGGLVVEIRDNNRMGENYSDGRYSNLVYNIKDDEWKYLEPVPGWIMTDEKVYMTFDSEMGGWTSAKKVDNEEGRYAIFNINHSCPK